MAVDLHKGGISIRVAVKRMFGDDGPWLLGQHRLDQLVSAAILQDSSTKTSDSDSSGSITAGTGSQIARGLAGAVVGGGAGAVVAATGGRRETQARTVTHEVLNLNVLLSLQFKDGSTVAATVTDEDNLTLIMGCVGQPEWSQTRLDGLRKWHEKEREHEEAAKAAARPEKKRLFAEEINRKLERQARDRTAKKYGIAATGIIVLIVALVLFVLL